MESKKRKKIYYRPGIFSMTILPIIFIYFANKEIKVRTSSSLTVYFADLKMIQNYPQMFLIYKGQFPPKRNYSEIFLTGNAQYDKIKIEFAHIRIKEILSQNDTINGVHFKFSDSSQYGSFVSALDVLKFEHAKTFMPLYNNLWFYNFPPDSLSERGTLLYK